MCKARARTLAAAAAADAAADQEWSFQCEDCLEVHEPEMRWDQRIVTEVRPRSQRTALSLSERTLREASAAPAKRAPPSVER